MAVRFVPQPLELGIARRAGLHIVQRQQRHLSQAAMGPGLLGRIGVFEVGERRHARRLAGAFGCTLAEHRRQAQLLHQHPMQRRDTLHRLAGVDHEAGGRQFVVVQSLVQVLGALKCMLHRALAARL